MSEYKLAELLSGITEANCHDEFPRLMDATTISTFGLDISIACGDHETKNAILAALMSSGVVMPREITDEQADAAMRATAVHLDIKGSQLTVNREKMKARYRALVKFIEAGNGL